MTIPSIPDRKEIKAALRRFQMLLAQEPHALTLSGLFNAANQEQAFKHIMQRLRDGMPNYDEKIAETLTRLGMGDLVAEHTGLYPKQATAIGLAMLEQRLMESRNNEIAQSVIAFDIGILDKLAGQNPAALTSGHMRGLLNVLCNRGPATTDMGYPTESVAELKQKGKAVFDAIAAQRPDLINAPLAGWLTYNLERSPLASNDFYREDICCPLGQSSQEVLDVFYAMARTNPQEAQAAYREESNREQSQERATWNQRRRKLGDALTKIQL